MKFFVLAVALAFATPVAAAPPTEAQAREMEVMLGMDAGTQVKAQHVIDRIDLTAATTTQKACLGPALATELQKGALKRVADAFHDGDTVDAWKAFALTPGGRRTVELLRTTAVALAQGSAAPETKSAEASLTPEERRDIVTFMGSPAAAVMRTGFGQGGEPSDAELDATIARAFASCGIQKR